MNVAAILIKARVVQGVFGVCCHLRFAIAFCVQNSTIELKMELENVEINAGLPLEAARNARNVFIYLTRRGFHFLSEMTTTIRCAGSRFSTYMNTQIGCQP